MNIKILKQSEQNHIKINNNNLSIVFVVGGEQKEGRRKCLSKSQSKYQSANENKAHLYKKKLRL